MAGMPSRTRRGALAKWLALAGVVAMCSPACAVVLGIDEPTDRVDASVDAAAPCTPPACGAPSGRCGPIDACGLHFDCGKCAPPFECVEGTCQCKNGATCGSLAATCGSFDDGCGTTVDCGGCDGGSCASTGDSGFACGASACTPVAASETCAGRCGKVPNNCAQTEACGPCQKKELCGGGGAVNKCGCPSRPLVVSQYRKFVDGKTYHCYSQGNGCAGWVYEGSMGRIYDTQWDSLLPLYRCQAVVSGLLVTFLSTSTNCSGLGGFVNQGTIGFCSPKAVCGALPLHRYLNPQTGDYAHGLGPAPGGYTQFAGDACFVWLP
jgi:hypothetical protein